MIDELIDGPDGPMPTPTDHSRVETVRDEPHFIETEERFDGPFLPADAPQRGWLGNMKGSYHPRSCRVKGSRILVHHLKEGIAHGQIVLGPPREPIFGEIIAGQTRVGFYSLPRKKD